MVLMLRGAPLAFGPQFTLTPDAHAPGAGDPRRLTRGASRPPLPPSTRTDMHAIGVDIGGTKIAAGVIEEAGSILAQTRRATEPDEA